MVSVFDEKAPREVTNLSINTDLLEKARQYNINLSKNFESYLASKIREIEAVNWMNENSDAIDEYNDRIDTKGTFSDEFRKF